MENILYSMGIDVACVDVEVDTKQNVLLDAVMRMEKRTNHIIFMQHALDKLVSKLHTIMRMTLLVSPSTYIDLFFDNIMNCSLAEYSLATLLFQSIVMLMAVTKIIFVQG